MSRRILIVPDKFKGTLTAHEAAAAIAAGWRRVHPQDEIRLLPMSDGGDGFGPILADHLQGETRRVPAMDAAHRPGEVEWWWVPAQRLAIVEAARANGLARLPKGQFSVTELDTYGVGMLLKEIAQFEPVRCIVGIGGSATNDGGFGVASALGWRFLDKSGNPIQRWFDLEALHRIVRPSASSRLGLLQVAVDVQNPLLGEQGCSRIYGPQKGLKPEQFVRAEACLATLASVLRETSTGCPASERLAELPGSGAAGGLGFGLAAFLGAELTPGFYLFASLAGLPDQIKSADLVITAEGSIDASSLMGKGVGGVTRLCRDMGRPCVGLAGVTDSDPGLRSHFVTVAALVPKHFSAEAAFADPSRCLETLAQIVATELSQGTP